MPLYAKGTFTGNYETRGDLERASIVAAHEFAVPIRGNGRAHEAMARIIAGSDRLMRLPKMLSQNVAAALIELEPGIEITEDDILGGESSGMMGGGVGTRGEIAQLKARMIREFGSVVPSVHLGHAQHIGRIGLQAAAQGLDTIILPGYPDGFDDNTTQPQCRSGLVWAAHELVGVPYLHLTGKF